MSRSSILVVLALLVGLAIGVSIPQAHADPAPTAKTAECAMLGTVLTTKTTPWLNEQLAAGRTGFVPIASSGLVCAY